MTRKEMCAGSLGCEIEMLGMARINPQLYSARGPRDLVAFRVARGLCGCVVYPPDRFSVSGH